MLTAEYILVRGSGSSVTKSIKTRQCRGHMCKILINQHFVSIHPLGYDAEIARKENQFVERTKLILEKHGPAPWHLKSTPLHEL